MGLRELAHGLTPPLVGAWLRSARHRLGGRRDDRGTSLEWEVVGDGWEHGRRHPEVRGWNDPSVRETQLKKWARFAELVEDGGPLGFAHESDLSNRLDPISHNVNMTFAYVLCLAAHRRDAISILDWGGGLGHYLILARALLPSVRIEYHCRDLDLLAREGARLLPDQHFTSDDGCLQRCYDLVMASTSLQYQEDWRSLLGRLARASTGMLYVTGLPLVLKARSFVFVQRARRFGYDTEYLAWCLNRDEFLAAAAGAELRLDREFVVGYAPPITGAPEQNHYRGFLFRRSTAEETAW